MVNCVRLMQLYELDRTVGEVLKKLKQFRVTSSGF